MQKVALVYVRKSVVRSKMDERSPERQRARCLQECERRGWKPEIFADAEGHRSGRSEKHRPAFRRLKAQLRRPGVVAVVVSALDRLSRSPKDFFNLLSLLQKHGVELVSLREKFDTSTAIGKAFVSIIMVIAALEADLASERTSASIEFRQSQGIHVGPFPFGMTREDGVLRGNQDADTAVRILEIYVERARGFKDTADYANSIPLRFRDHSGDPVPFTFSGVRSVLSNALVYLGLIPSVPSRKMTVPKNVDTSRSLVDQMAEAYDAKEGEIEPIITRELAERVIAMRLERQNLHITKGRRPYVLTPALYCAACGGPLRGHTRRGRSFYVHHRRTCNPGHGSHDAEELELRVRALFQDVQLPPGLVSFLQEKVNERLANKPGNEEASRAIQHLQAKMDRLKELYVEGDICRDQYDECKDALQSSIAEWNMELGSTDYDVPDVLDKLGDLTKLISCGTLSQQKRAVNAAFKRIEVGLDGVVKRIEPHSWSVPLFADLADSLESTLDCLRGSSRAWSARLGA